MPDVSTYRICYVLPTFRLGGTEKQVVRLSQGIRHRFVPFFLCLNEKRDVCSWASLSEDAVFEARMRRFWDGRVLIRASRILRRIRPHIVHTFLFDANIWGVLAARCAGVPVVLSSRRSVDAWQKRRHILMERVSNCLVDAVTANSRAVAEFTARQESLTPQKIRLIYNGVDLATHAPSASRSECPDMSGMGQDGVVIGMVATLFDEKRHDLFLRAAKIVVDQAPCVRFLIVGDGPSRQHVVSAIERLGLERVVRLTGELRDPTSAYSSMDISVLCSDREGFSNAILEAMAHALPVVATDVGGNSEAVSHGQTGFITPRGDADSLASRLLELVRNPDLRRQMGSQGRVKAEREFSMPRCLSEHLTLYEELIRSKGPF